MKLAIYTLCDQESGMGHFTRMQALASEAHNEGHDVIFLSNRAPDISGVNHAQIRKNDPDGLRYASSPHWLIVDLPGKLPEFIKSYTGKKCYIDGLGHPSKNGLVVSQGLQGKYCAPKYVILRQELISQVRELPTNDWFVFGGAADVMSLHDKFSRARLKEEAMFIATEFNRSELFGARHWLVHQPSPDSLYFFMKRCRRACVAMGMVVWELLYLKLPIYVFSRSKRHLRTAQAMADRGWLKAYPKVGIPAQIPDSFFEDFSPEPCPVDGQGAERLLTLLMTKQ